MIIRLSLLYLKGFVGEGIPQGRRLGGVLGGYVTLLQIPKSFQKKKSEKKIISRTNKFSICIFGHITYFIYFCTAILNYTEFLSWYTLHQEEGPALIGVYFTNSERGYPSKKYFIDERCFSHRCNCEKVKGKERFGKLHIICNRRGIINLYGKALRNP